MNDDEARQMMTESEITAREVEREVATATEQLRNERDLARAERDAYRKLLRRYVNHVGESEGTDFLSERWPSPELTDNDRAMIQIVAYADEDNE